MSLRATIALCLMALGPAFAGCSARPTSEVLVPVAQVPSYTAKVRLLVATTRERGTSEDPNAFSSLRSETVNHAALTISIPRNHKPGQIEWPDQVPADPAFHFLTTDRSFLSPQAFGDEVRRSVQVGRGERGSVLVFVHGYNTLYEEAVYRYAQIVHDSGFSGTAILFAWPSRGKAPLYLADRDASTYSRDYFERTLLQIAGVPGVREINILAHSMGSWITVEALRQARMKRNGSFNGKLGDVILASPDLDIGVLRTQLDVIGALKRPMVILASKDDNVLALSSFLSGGVERAGNISTDNRDVIDAAHRYNVRIVDLSQVDDGTSAHHAKFAESGAVIAAIGRGLKADAAAKSSQSVVTAVTNVGSSLLALPAAIVGAGGPAQ